MLLPPLHYGCFRSHSSLLVLASRVGDAQPEESLCRLAHELDAWATDTITESTRLADPQVFHSHLTHTVGFR